MVSGPPEAVKWCPMCGKYQPAEGFAGYFCGGCSPASKQCCRCGQVKPLEDFSADPRTRTGRDYRCRKCKSASQRRTYAQDPEKAEQARASARRYYWEHREEINARRRWHKLPPTKG